MGTIMERTKDILPNIIRNTKTPCSYTAVFQSAMEYSAILPKAGEPRFSGAVYCFWK